MPDVKPLQKYGIHVNESKSILFIQVISKYSKMLLETNMNRVIATSKASLVSYVNKVLRNNKATQVTGIPKNNKLHLHELGNSCPSC